MAMTTTPPSGEPEAHGSDGRQAGRRGRDGRLRRVWERRGSRLAVGVAAAAIALTAAAVALAQGIGTFRDVPDNHYARDATQWAVQNGITVGCRDGTYFCPERTVNRAESVTFLHRYQNNVISPLENRVRALEGRSVQGPTTPFDPNAGFGNQPPATTVPLRKFTTRGTQTQIRSFNLPAGVYEAVFTLEATKAARDHNQDTDDAPEPVTLIQVEYRENSSSAWKTYAVSTLMLDGGTLPTAEWLFQQRPATGTVDVEIANVPGRLPTSGQIRVSAYMADNSITPNDDDNDPDRTTKYDFSWGIILTEKRP